MCLQWCHVRGLVIDNDLPCTGCTRFPAHSLPVQEHCSTCIHMKQENGAQALCALSRMPLPKIGRCCHYNVVEDDRRTVQLSTAHVAPEVLQIWDVADVAELFAQSASAPDYAVVEGLIHVDLWDLALPFVYGVPAPFWGAALSETFQATTAPTEIIETIIAIAEADALNEDAKEQRQHLRLLLKKYPRETIPEDWWNLIDSVQ